MLCVDIGGKNMDEDVTLCIPVWLCDVIDQWFYISAK